MILNQAHRSRDGLYEFFEAQKYVAKSTDEADVEGLESLAADMALEGQTQGSGLLMNLARLVNKNANESTASDKDL
jgi:hypothetical protein